MHKPDAANKQVAITVHLKDCRKEPTACVWAQQDEPEAPPAVEEMTEPEAVAIAPEHKLEPSNKQVAEVTAVPAAVLAADPEPSGLAPAHYSAAVVKAPAKAAPAPVAAKGKWWSTKPRCVHSVTRG